MQYACHDATKPQLIVAWPHLRVSGPGTASSPTLQASCGSPGTSGGGCRQGFVAGSWTCTPWGSCSRRSSYPARRAGAQATTCFSATCQTSLVLSPLNVHATLVHAPGHSQTRRQQYCCLGLEQHHTAALQWRASAGGAVCGPSSVIGATHVVEVGLLNIAAVLVTTVAVLATAVLVLAL